MSITLTTGTRKLTDGVSIMNDTVTITCKLSDIKRICDVLITAYHNAQLKAMWAKETELNGRDEMTERAEYWRDETEKCEHLAFGLLYEAAYQPHITKEVRLALDI